MAKRRNGRGKKAKKFAAKRASKPVRVTLRRNYSPLQKLLGFVELARPVEWSKSFLNMLFAMFIAYYLYNSGVSLWIFVLGFAAVAALWSGLYSLNDYTDWRIDALHEIKKLRPIPSGRVSPTQGFAFSVLMLVVSFFVAFYLNNFLLIVCLGAMVLNQWLYTMKPFRLKSRKGLDLVSGSMINPIFRYFSGLVLFVPPVLLFSQITPILPLIFAVSVQFAGYSLYRLFSKHHDKKLNMRSTAALVNEEKVKTFSYGAIGISFLAYIFLFINYFTLKNTALGYLPPQYLAPMVVSLLAAPFIKEGVLDPTKANLREQYKSLYLVILIFVVTNLAVFLFAR